MQCNYLIKKVNIISSFDEKDEFFVKMTIEFYGIRLYIISA